MTTYEYKCNDCGKTYEFTHPQTYKNCNACEFKGELRLRSIEIQSQKEGES